MNFALAALMLTSSIEAQPPTTPEPVELAQVTIQERVIIRVQTIAPQSIAPSANANQRLPKAKSFNWKESKADKCVAVSNLNRASVTQGDSIDLMMRDGRRMRAKLASNCPALDFYSGFYVKPSKDGKICAQRDVILSRSGSECAIQAFRGLTPTP